MYIKLGTQITIKQNNPLIIGTRLNVLLITTTNIYDLTKNKNLIDIDWSDLNSFLKMKDVIHSQLKCEDCINLTYKRGNIILEFNLFGINSRGLENLVIYDYYIVDRDIPLVTDRVNLYTNCRLNPNLTNNFLVPLNIEKAKLDDLYPIVLYEENTAEEINSFYPDSNIEVYMLPSIYLQKEHIDYSMADLLFYNLHNDYKEEKYELRCLYMTYYKRYTNNNCSEKYDCLHEQSTSLNYFVNNGIDKHGKEAALIISSDSKIARLFGSEHTQIKCNLTKLNHYCSLFFENLNSICILEKEESEKDSVTYKYVVYKYDHLGIVRTSLTLATAKILNGENVNIGYPRSLNLLPINSYGEIEVSSRVTYLEKDSMLFYISHRSYCIQHNKSKVMSLYSLVLTDLFTLKVKVRKLKNSDFNGKLTIRDIGYLAYPDTDKYTYICKELDAYTKSVMEELTSVCQLPDDDKDSYTQKLINRNLKEKAYYQDAIDSGCCIFGTIRFLNILKRYERNHSTEVYVSDDSGYQNPRVLRENIDSWKPYKESWILLPFLYSKMKYDRMNISSTINHVLFIKLGYLPYSTELGMVIPLPEAYLKKLKEKSDKQQLLIEKDEVILDYKEEDEELEENDGDEDDDEEDDDQ